jgi:L-lactate dehydrogenase complex protein LldG
MKPTSHAFTDNARHALHDRTLQQALVLLSGPDSPTTLNFLPAGRIVPRMEDAWDLLRGERGELPRAINIVSGPSRTADVEQTIQLGAHGPRRLHVLLLGDASG